jgi:hypothetical protein
MRARASRVLLACALGVVASACARTTATDQLVDARRAYAGALQSPAAHYAADDLRAARKALERAEAAHKADPGSRTEAHLGYIAARRAQIAAVNGCTLQAQKAEARARSEYQSKKSTQQAQDRVPPPDEAAKSFTSGQGL